MAAWLDKILLVTLSLAAGIAIGAHPRVAAFVSGGALSWPPAPRDAPAQTPDGPAAAPTPSPAPATGAPNFAAFPSPREVAAEAAPSALRSLDEELAGELDRGALDGPPGSRGRTVAVVSFLAGLALPDLPVREEPLVARYLRFFTATDSGRAIVRGWLSRRPRYQALIERALRDHALPGALEAIVCVESGFSTTALSPAGARGLWQLMPATARGYGLGVAAEGDERIDPERSTEAAVRFLTYLRRELGNWDLVLAAYNAGLGAVSSRLKAAGADDFWELKRPGARLPEETRLYVPKVLAVAIVLANLEAFGFHTPLPVGRGWARASAVSWPTGALGLAEGLTVDTPFASLLEGDDDRLAVATGGAADREQVRGYTWSARPDDGARLVRLHEGPAAVATQSYEVQPGDTLSRIARRHGLTTQALARDNGLTDPALVRIGQRLLIRDDAAPRRPEGAVAPGSLEGSP